MIPAGERRPKKWAEIMKTGTVTKLLFTGIASGIALSCAIVLATSVTTVSSEKSDKSVVRNVADAKADLERGPTAAQEVARHGKSDALDITLAILKGEDIAPDDPAPFYQQLETFAAETPEAAAPPAPETPLDGLRLTRVPDAAEVVKPEIAVAPAEPRPAPRTRTVKVSKPVGDPVAIIPDAEPVESQPVAAPTTTTNFTIEPVTSQQSLSDRSDLER